MGRGGGGESHTGRDKHSHSLRLYTAVTGRVPQPPTPIQLTIVDFYKTKITCVCFVDFECVDWLQVIWKKYWLQVMC